MAALRRPAAVATLTAMAWRSRRSSTVRPGRGRLLDELLVAALEGAVALPDGDDPAGRVAQELDLDVARRDDLALEVDRAVAERRGRLARPADQRRRQVRGRDHPAHPPAAAAGRRLDQQREADRLGLGDDRGDLVRSVDRRRLERSRDGRDPDVACRSPGMQLVAEGIDRRRTAGRRRRARHPRRRGRRRLARPGSHSPDGSPPRRSARAASTIASIRR